jgi:hypothetical protein
MTGMRAALSFWADIQRYSAPQSSCSTANMAFQAGKCLMTINWSVCLCQAEFSSLLSLRNGHSASLFFSFLLLAIKALCSHMLTCFAPIMLACNFDLFADVVHSFTLNCFGHDCRYSALSAVHGHGKVLRTHLSMSASRVPNFAWLLL